MCYTYLQVEHYINVYMGKVMKKVFVKGVIIGIAMALTTAFSACSKSDNSDSKINSDVSSESTAAKKPEKANEKKAEGKAEEKAEEKATNEEIYESVNDSVVSIISSAAFEAATEEQDKADVIITQLDALVKEGKVAEGTVHYKAGDGIVTFSFADGAYGGVLLEDFDGPFSGRSTGDYVTSYDENGLIKTWDNDVKVFDGIEKPYEEEVSAQIISGLGDAGIDYNEALVRSMEREVSWTQDGLKTTLQRRFGVDEFRKKLPGDPSESGKTAVDLLFINHHGSMYDDEPIIAVDGTNSVEVVTDDMLEHRVAMLLYGNSEVSKRYYGLLPEFFTHYYENDGLKDAIVWLGSCHGFENDKLVKAFADCGAKAVLGYSDTVYTEYDSMMEEAFVFSLLYGNTVQESCDFAKAMWGVNDEKYWENYYTHKDMFKASNKEPAELKIYNGMDERLVTLTEEAKEQKVREPISIDDLSFEKILEINNTFNVLNTYNSIKYDREVYTSDPNNNFEYALSLSYAIEFVQTPSGREYKWGTRNYNNDNSLNRRLYVYMQNENGLATKYSFDLLVDPNGVMKYGLKTHLPQDKEITSEQCTTAADNAIEEFGIDYMLQKNKVFINEPSLKEVEDGYLLHLDYTDTGVMINGEYQVAHADILCDKSTGLIESITIMEEQNVQMLGHKIEYKNIEYGTLNHVTISDEDALLFEADVNSFEPLYNK